jgi:hypothetical protein
MGIADEQQAHTLGTAKSNRSVRALMPQVPDLPTLTGAGFSSSRLQAPIAARPFLAPVTFPGDLPQSLIMPPLEGANTSAGHHQSHTRIGGHRRLMNFT